MPVNMLCLQCHTFSTTLRPADHRARAQSIGEVSGLHHVSHPDSRLQLQQCLFQVGSTDGVAKKTRPAIFRWWTETHPCARMPVVRSSRVGRTAQLWQILPMAAMIVCSPDTLFAQTPSRLRLQRHGESGASRAAEPDGITRGGYQIHSSIELGYRSTDVTGSGDMYDTLVNLQTGPRILDQTLSMQSLDHQGLLFDNLYLNSVGWGGDPNNSLRLRADKNKWYNLQGSFRRDQNFSDFDLLANPLNPPNLYIHRFRR